MRRPKKRIGAGPLNTCFLLKVGPFGWRTIYKHRIAEGICNNRHWAIGHSTSPTLNYYNPRSIWHTITRNVLDDAGATITSPSHNNREHTVCVNCIRPSSAASCVCIQAFHITTEECAMPTRRNRFPRPYCGDHGVSARTLVIHGAAPSLPSVILAYKVPKLMIGSKPTVQHPWSVVHFGVHHRIFSIDPRALNHVLKHTNIYTKSDLLRDLVR